MYSRIFLSNSRIPMIRRRLFFVLLLAVEFVQLFVGYWNLFVANLAGEFFIWLNVSLRVNIFVFVLRLHLLNN